MKTINVGILPLKISSARLPMKNILPVEGTPSFVHVLKALTETMDKVYVIVERPYIHFCRAWTDGLAYTTQKIIVRYPIKAGVHKSGSTVDMVVNEVVSKLKGENINYTCVYPTMFNVTPAHISNMLLKSKGNNGFPVGYIRSDGKPIGISMFTEAHFYKGGHYADEFIPIKGEEYLVDIDNYDHFYKAVRLRHENKANKV